MPSSSFAFARTLEMLRQESWIRRAMGFEPFSRELVTDGSIALGKRRIGAFTQQHVSKREFRFVRKPTLRSSHQYLVFDQTIEPLFCGRRMFRSTKQCRNGT